MSARTIERVGYADLVRDVRHLAARAAPDLVGGRSFTLRELHAILCGHTNNRSYLATRLGADVQEYLAWKRKGRTRPRTLDQYERDLSRLALAIPDTTLEEVQAVDLILLLDLIPEGSWARFRAAWNGMFRWAQRFGRRPDNPCDQLPELQRRNTKPVYPIFALPEQQALINGCATSLLPDVDRARVNLLLDTGARKGEACGVQFGDIDLRERVILLHGKGGKPRLVPIHRETATAIDVLLIEGVHGRDLEPDHFLWFPWSVSKMHTTGERRLNRVYPERPMMPRGFHEWWAGKYGRVAAAEIRYRKPHMTRHTFATDLLDADANPHDVQELMGHADMRATEVYLHSSRKRLHRATDKLAAYRHGNDPEA
ncbi:MAG: tyrosine-type recombinase/integrase [Gemmatimonadaceae bacterium]|nr:tyrosine-type recombinase/integrase [Gemmatimonadaceae bacterium]